MPWSAGDPARNQHETLMKKLTFTLIMTSLLLAGICNPRPLLAQGQYDNTLYIEDTEALVDSEITLSVKMKNSVDAEGFAFDLILPRGMTVVCDDEGTPSVSLSPERTTPKRTDTFMAAMLTAYPQNNAVRVIAASTNASAIPAGDGEVCTVRIRIPEVMSENVYRLQLRNISISDTEAHSHDTEQTASKITIRDLSLGDANGDGKMTVADLVAIAHYVLENPPADFSIRAADVNMDCIVNIADYIGVAHLLGEDPTQSQGGFPRMPRMNPEQTATE